jgi:hypothetical protein
MNTKITYICDRCDDERTESMKIGVPPSSSFNHEGCGGTYHRRLGNIFLDKQEDTVSWATQQVMYGGMPSGKDKAAL